MRGFLVYWWYILKDNYNIPSHLCACGIWMYVSEWICVCLCACARVCVLKCACYVDIKVWYWLSYEDTLEQSPSLSIELTHQFIKPVWLLSPRGSDCFLSLQSWDYSCLLSCPAFYVRICSQAFMLVHKYLTNWATSPVLSSSTEFFILATK